MGLETGVNFIDDLVAANPLAGDDPSEGDDHIRAIKTAVQGSFTSLGSAAVTATAAELNIMDGVTKSTADINGLLQSGEIIIQETVQPSTSGTAIAFTSIPAWVQKITIMLDQVSTSTGAALQVVIGDAGGYEAATYSAYGENVGSGTFSSTSGFVINSATGSTQNLIGTVTLSLLDTANTWISSGNLADPTRSDMMISGGTKSLSATLDKVKVEASAGAFDAGQINILYE